MKPTPEANILKPSTYNATHIDQRILDGIAEVEQAIYEEECRKREELTAPLRKLCEEKGISYDEYCHTKLHLDYVDDLNRKVKYFNFPQYKANEMIKDSADRLAQRLALFKGEQQC